MILRDLKLLVKVLDGWLYVVIDTLPLPGRRLLVHVRAPWSHILALQIILEGTRLLLTVRTLQVRPSAITPLLKLIILSTVWTTLLIFTVHEDVFWLHLPIRMRHRNHVG